MCTLWGPSSRAIILVNMSRAPLVEPVRRGGVEPKLVKSESGLGVGHSWNYSQ